MAKFTGPHQAVTLVDRDGNTAGTADLPVEVTGDVTDNQLANILTDGSQLAQVTGTGTAGVPAAGVVTIQGIAGGEPLPITGTISASNPSVDVVGDPVPLSATLIGGEDSAGDLIAPNVASANPVGTEVGLVVRNIPSGTQPVSAVALPLPAGAAEEATLAGVLTTTAFEARLNSQGQKTMAGSTPVVLASDQSPIAVTGSFSNPSVGLTSAAVPTSANLVGGVDASGNLTAPAVLSSTPTGTEAGMVVRPVGQQEVLLSSDVVYALNMIAATLSLARDNAGRLRVLVDPIGGAQSVPVTVSSGTVTTVTTVGTVSNQTSIGGAIANTVVVDGMVAAWATAVRPNIVHS